MFTHSNNIQIDKEKVRLVFVDKTMSFNGDVPLNIPEETLEYLTKFLSMLSFITKVNDLELLVEKFDEYFEYFHSISIFLYLCMLQNQEFQEKTEISILVDHQNLLYRITHILNYQFSADSADWEKLWEKMQALTSIIDIDANVTDEDYLFDFLIVKHYLNDKKECNAAFGRLEENLQLYATEIKADLVSEPNKLKQLPSPSNDKPYNKQKILSGFLYRWAKEQNLNKEEYVEILDILDRDTFLEFVAKKMLLKDFGAGYKHGTWPHVLQLFLIIELNKIYHFMAHDPVDLYAYLGNPLCKSKSNLSTIWDKVVDLPPGKATGYDNPENLTEYLYKDGQKSNPQHPILSFSIFLTYKKKQETEKQKKENIIASINNEQSEKSLPYLVKNYPKI